MEINFKIGGVGLAVMVAVAAGAWYLAPRLGPKTETTASVMADEVPVVIRTAGGLLEVANLRAHERFTRSDTREFWGIPLGTTVSHIQVPALYRYHIQLAPEWTVTLRGKTCLVVAPPIRPSLPVAFDTTLVQKYTINGWARFNKDDNLAELEHSMTPVLAQRAASPAYLKLVADPARQTVKEFVIKWLLKTQQGQRDVDLDVKVVFEGESGAQVARVD